MAARRAWDCHVAGGVALGFCSRRTLATVMLLALVMSATLYGMFARKQSTEPLSCNPVVNCVFGTPGHTHTLRFEPAPQPLTPFQAVVTGINAPTSITFEMAGMQMGENRFSFRSTGRGEWRADVLLPVCVTGRSDWRAALQFADATFSVSFSMPSR